MTEPDVLATLAKLPPRCFASIPSSRGPRTVLIIRGVPGYTDMDTSITVHDLNSALPKPPTPEQVEAMLVGSMFGWHVPGADPDIVRARSISETVDSRPQNSRCAGSKDRPARMPSRPQFERRARSAPSND